MNLTPPSTRRHHRGMTLIELTVAIMIGAAVAGIMIALFNQQLAFLRIFRIQNFLNEEAPLVSMHVSRIVGQADRYRLHNSVDDAINGQNQQLGDSPVLLMNFLQPDGTMRASMLAFETRNDRQALYYHLVPESGIIAEPEWFVTDQVADVRFAIEQGVLRMRLTGNNGEEITYSGTMQ